MRATDGRPQARMAARSGLNHASKLVEELTASPGNTRSRLELVRMMLRNTDGKDVLVNRAKLQSKFKANTCGWAYARATLADLPLKKFIEITPHCDSSHCNDQIYFHRLSEIRQDVEDEIFLDAHPTIEFKRYLPDWTLIEYLNNLKNIFNLNIIIKHTYI